MKNTQLSNYAVAAQADTLATALNSGYLRLYAGVQPVSADIPAGIQPLVELRFQNPAATSTSAGLIVFNPPVASYATAVGTAAWYRCTKSDGTTVVMDGSISPTGQGGNMELNAVDIPTGALVSVGSFMHSVNKSAAGV